MNRKVPTVAVLVLMLVGCGHSPGQPPHVATTAPEPPPITFLEDDYAGALLQARATHRPIFVDAWAAWCHTCLSMREYVFPDRQIRALGAKFVWLAIDTEKPQNAGFLANHSMDAWPTFWVIDPVRESPTLRWVGSATAGELALLLEDAQESPGGGVEGSADAGAEYLRGNRAAAAGKTDESILHYQAALHAAPAGWPRRARAVEALSQQQWAKKDWLGCISLAAEELPGLSPGTSRKAVAANGLMCADSVSSSGPVSAQVSAQCEAIVAQTKRIVDDLADPMLADDRSDLFEELVGALKTAGKTEEARRTAVAWAAFLDREASGASSSAARAVFDAHRLDAYLELDDPAAAIPLLMKSEKDFPSDYNPPARLASAYLALKDYAHALAAIERGLARVYGPRKLRLLSLKATILGAQGDAAGERATLAEAVALAGSLPLMGSQIRLKAELEKRLEQRTRK